MKINYPLLTVLLVSFLMIGCNSPENNEEDLGELIQIDTVSTPNKQDKKKPEHTTTTDPIYADDTLNAFVARIKALDRERENDYYKRYVSMKGTYGDVYFYNGKHTLSFFSDSDIGLNGRYICYYDAQEQLVLIEAWDHSNTWYRQECFVVINDTLYEDVYRGGDPSNPLPKRRYRFQVAEQSWMDKNLYEKTKNRSRFLMHDAVYKQLALPGTRYYKGLIDDKHAIQMRLNFDNTSANGRYHYANGNEAIKLSGRIKNDSIIITEKVNEAVTGKFKGILSDSDYSIKGTWYNADETKSYPFTLELAEAYETVDGRYLQSIAITPEQVEQYGNQVFGVD